MDWRTILAVAISVVLIIAVPLLIQVIAMGERTGRMDELLLQTADAYEKETAAAIGRTMTILPAVFIVLLALVVMFILTAVLLPIIDMQTSIPGA